jgi:hypothetical protein
MTLPLAVVGSQVGHALAYRLVTPDGAERAHELAATGHGYLAYAPLALAICTVVVALSLGIELRLVVRGGRSSRPSAFTFAVLAPTIFLLQEHFERLLHDGTFPWHAVTEPTFVAGLLLQLPFAVAAFVAARLLLRVVRAFGRLLSQPPRARAAMAATPLAARVVAPRLPVLALGYGSRGPPSPHS